jgi:PTH1 family peptidyl-tRNA hydrolase
MNMLLVIGLGNPGKEYEFTYHNAGALVLRQLWKELRNSFGSIEKSKYFTFSKGVDPETGENFVFVWPETYMNESGVAVRAALKFFKAKTTDLIVFHDDSDLRVGAAKISDSPNAAGHHGLMSIQKEIDVRSFRRLKIGIRDPKEKKHRKAEEFVLKTISRAKLERLYPEDLIPAWQRLRRKS